MDIKVEKQPKSKIKFSIKATGEEVAKFFDRALEVLSKDLKVSGFRPGKVPKEMAVDSIGKQAIQNQARELPINDTYFEMINRDKLVPLDQPKNVKVKRVGRDTYKRSVHTIINNDNSKEGIRLIIGETFNKEGRWSSFPPHKHVEIRPPYETRYEEVFFFKVRKKNGFGLQTLEGDFDICFRNCLSFCMFSKFECFFCYINGCILKPIH